MLHETDIPCSDCGTELVEQTVQVGELSITTDWQGDVTVVECPSCDARYYPDKTISRLASVANDSVSPRDTRFV
jgi:uncharacterized protein with PIN domain